MHELVALADDQAREDLELVPREQTTLELVMIRCPSCQGLRGVSARRAREGHSATCIDCIRGHIVPRWTYCQWWVDRFSMEEIKLMARSIWG